MLRNLSRLQVIVLLALLMNACTAPTPAPTSIATALPVLTETATSIATSTSTPALISTAEPAQASVWTVGETTGIVWAFVGDKDMDYDHVLPEHQTLWQQLADALIFSELVPCQVTTNCAIFTAHASKGDEILVVRAGDLSPVYFPITDKGNTKWSGSGDWSYSLGHGDQVAVLIGISTSGITHGELKPATDSNDAINSLALVDKSKHVTAILSGPWGDGKAQWLIRDANSALGKDFPDLPDKQLVAIESGDGNIYVGYFNVITGTRQIDFSSDQTLDGTVQGMWIKGPDGSWTQAPGLKYIATITPMPTLTPTITPVPSPTATSGPTRVPKPTATKVETTPSCPPIPDGDMAYRQTGAIGETMFHFGALDSLRGNITSVGRVTANDGHMVTINTGFAEYTYNADRVPVFLVLPDRDVYPNGQPDPNLILHGKCGSLFQIGDRVEIVLSAQNVAVEDWNNIEVLANYLQLYPDQIRFLAIVRKDIKWP